MQAALATVRAFDPARDLTALWARLGVRLTRHGDAAARRLACAWLRGTDGLGMTLDGPEGEPQAWLFWRGFAGVVARIGRVLGDAAELAELLGAGLPLFQVRHPGVVCQSGIWDHVMGIETDALASVWAAHGFESLTLLILECPLPAPGYAGGVPPPGVRLALPPWTYEERSAATRLFRSALDPLQARAPAPSLVGSGVEETGALAWRGDELVGVVTASPTGQIGQLAVAPAERGRGIGAALLDHALAALARLGRTRARLVMAAGNEAAWRLYSRRGFKPRLEYPYRWWRQPE